MEVTALFSFVPKIAFVFLIIIGILIVVELVHLLQSHRKKTIVDEPPVPDQQPQEAPLPSVKFPTSGFVMTPQQQKSRGGGHKKTVVTILIILIVFVILFLGIHLLSQIGQPPADTQPVPQAEPQETTTPTPAPTLAPVENTIASTSGIPLASPNTNQQVPEIRIYTSDKDGNWILRGDQQLSSLQAGDSLYIAVFSPLPYTSAQFIINEKEYTSEPVLSPFNEFYIQYQIPDNVVDFHIAVHLISQ
ncbi:hypothetical protein HY468_04975 [Candidatus Roizmanbacteria bacterium]|nr:hypothetical protein [Candidatus Roizmanbacteria bacterium]